MKLSDVHTPAHDTHGGGGGGGTVFSSSILELSSKVGHSSIAGAKLHRSVRTRFLEEHLQDPVFAIPLAQLEDIWYARFGYTWVKQKDLLALAQVDQADPWDYSLPKGSAPTFWTLCYNRLRGSSRLELINIGGEPEPVARLIEK